MLEPFNANVGAKRYIDGQIARVAQIRDAVGDEMDIAIDFHGRINPDMAIQIIDGLTPYRPLFVEEACLPENIEAMGLIAKKSLLPLATGERLVTRFGIKNLLESHAVSVIQPDLCHAGGLPRFENGCTGETYMSKLHRTTPWTHLTCSQHPIGCLHTQFPHL